MIIQRKELILKLLINDNTVILTFSKFVLESRSEEGLYRSQGKLSSLLSGEKWQDSFLKRKSSNTLFWSGEATELFFSFLFGFFVLHVAVITVWELGLAVLVLAEARTQDPPGLGSLRRLALVLDSSNPVGWGHSATSHPTILASQVAWTTELSH